MFKLATGKSDEQSNPLEFGRVESAEHFHKSTFGATPPQGWREDQCVSLCQRSVAFTFSG